jgi:hypothetical protein
LISFQLSGFKGTALALEEAKKTVHGITGVVGYDCGGNIIEYHTVSK